MCRGSRHRPCVTFGGDRRSAVANRGTIRVQPSTDRKTPRCCPSYHIGPIQAGADHIGAGRADAGQVAKGAANADPSGAGLAELGVRRAGRTRANAASPARRQYRPTRKMITSHRGMFDPLRERLKTARRSSTETNLKIRRRLAATSSSAGATRRPTEDPGFQQVMDHVWPPSSARAPPEKARGANLAANVINPNRFFTNCKAIASRYNLITCSVIPG